MNWDFDETGIDELGIDEMGIDETGARHMNARPSMDTVTKLRRQSSFGGSNSDIGALVSDSFSSDGGVSDDSRSSSWMQRIDVSNFKQLQQDPSLPSTTHLDHGVYSRPSAPTFPSPADSCSSTIVMSPPLKQKRYNHPNAVVHPEGSEEEEQHLPGKIFPKPIYSYSCLIALSLKNSKTGRLTVAEIYSFMCENFPYFCNAPAGWKNSVRHNLSLNKCFEKIELEAPGGHGRKSCLWTMNPAKKTKMDNEIKKWREKDVEGVIESLANPRDLEAIESGRKGLPGASNQSYLLRNFPEMISQRNFPEMQRNCQSSSLLLVERPFAQNYSAYPQQTNLQRQVVSANSQMLQSSYDGGKSSPAAWSSGELSSPGGSWNGSAPPCTPPRPQHSSPYVHTYMSGELTSPHARSGVSHTQVSPFSHTPPYSPNMHSPHSFTPQQRTVHTDWLAAVQACSTPRHDYTYNHRSLEDYYGNGSPLKVNYMPNPYDTTANALHDNSLLQTALTNSPQRNDFTLQRL